MAVAQQNPPVHRVRDAIEAARVRARVVSRVARARMAGRVFYCQALSGLSDFSIAINSDLSVSCNCADVDGSGQIGDLTEQDLAEVLQGERAARLRSELAAGRLPLAFCAACSELRVTDRAEATYYREHASLPHRGLMVENTSLCNLHCSGCRRQQLQRTRRRTSMSLDDMERVARLVQHHQIRKVHFFNLGEPFVSPRVREELQLLRDHNPELEIVSSTNGQLLGDSDKLEAALLVDYLYFSLDGPNQAIMQKYQTDADWRTAYANLAAVVAARDARGRSRPLIDWKYVLFRWNDRRTHVEAAVDLARQAHADFISFWPGYASLWNRSYRYRYHPYFRSLGTPQARWRRLDLRR